MTTETPPTTPLADEAIERADRRSSDDLMVLANRGIGFITSHGGPAGSTLKEIADTFDEVLRRYAALEAAALSASPLPTLEREKPLSGRYMVEAFEDRCRVVGPFYKTLKPAQQERDMLNALTPPATGDERLRKALKRVIEAAERAIGDHVAPGDCYATGPLTGNPFADLVACPGCVALNEIADAKAALSGDGGK